MLEDNYQPKGWFGAMLGNKLWYSPFSRQGGFEAGCSEMIKQIKKAIGDSASATSASTF